MWTTTASPLPHSAAVTGSATHFHIKCGAPGMEIAPAKPSVGTGCGAPHGKDWGLEGGRGGRGRCHVDTKQVRTPKQSESVANVSPLIRAPQIITEPSLTSFISSNKAERRPTRCTRLELKRKPVPRLQKHTSTQFRGLFYHTTACHKRLLKISKRTFRFVKLIFFQFLCSCDLDLPRQVPEPGTCPCTYTHNHDEVAPATSSNQRDGNV